MGVSGLPDSHIGTFSPHRLSASPVGEPGPRGPPPSVLTPHFILGAGLGPAAQPAVWAVACTRFPRPSCPIVMAIPTTHLHVPHSVGHHRRLGAAGSSAPCCGE